MADLSILCIAPDHAVCEALEAHGWQVHCALELAAAQRLLRRHRMPVGLWMPAELDDEACREMEAFFDAHDEPEWVAAFDAAWLALPACRDLVLNRLFDHHTTPIELPGLLMTLAHAHAHAAMRRAAHGEAGAAADHAIVGQSAAVEEMLRQIRRIARADAPVLIAGESGSGKELAAQAIHRQSSRAARPFVPINCGAIAPQLIQSTLFGHVKGSFTGASRDEVGLIESAAGGTVLLDEIGDLPLELQINLLRFLQEGTIHRVGSTRSLRVDVRVIAATNVDLRRAVASGAFREDLFYRLNVLQLRVPALRERQSDIELLAQHFFRQFARDKSPRLKGFSRHALLAMREHGWPGNVRELMNSVRRAMVMAEGRLVTPADLGLVERGPVLAAAALDEARVQAERRAIFGSLQQAGRNVTRAAQQLGVSRMTLYRLMAKHGISH
jgi:DNA-binding NtrC family response regulator